MPETLAVSQKVAAGSDFTPLAQQVRASGLLDRRTGYYACAITVNVLATVAIWVGVAVIDSWWALLLAVPAAAISARSGFLGHDAGHRQISDSARTSRLLGYLLGNLMIGMSYGWWNDKHNRHHGNPNHVDKDPDVGTGALVFSAGEAVGRSGALGWLTRHQAKLFFPMLLLEGLSLQVSSFQGLKDRARKDRVAEAVLLVVHAVGYLALAFTLMTPGKAVVFILVHQGLLGLHLGMAFAPNHKGMPMPGPGERWDHLRKQVLTSRNVRGGRVTDWFLGGLNYQVEHHLFPSIPRPNLRKVQPLVRAHCVKVGLPYVETGLVESYRQALRHLHDVAAPLRVE
ncbi:MAG: delta-6 fatty acid desaturase [Actinomycetia bacterium]|nr:delta-6 fatty acid desaturase [Actinomycetes bacterium]